MAPRGRPSLLSTNSRSMLIEAIKAGCPYEPACEYAGVSYSTFREWMQRGMNTHPTRKSTKEYVEFAEEVTRAKAHGEISAIVAIRAACKEDWRAAAWMLERRHPDRWANNQRIELQVQERTAQELTEIYTSIASAPNLTEDEKRKMLETIAGVSERAAIGVATN